jgi:hypothetical protein
MALSNASVAPKAESRGEFEALKRFGDYEELRDGTLMRVEGDMEFRIYCEDVEGCPIGIVTEGVLNLFPDLSDDASKEAHNTSEQETSFPDFIPISSQASADRTKPKKCACDVTDVPCDHVDPIVVVARRVDRDAAFASLGRISAGSSTARRRARSAPASRRS